MKEAQRFPDDFNGIIAGAPGLDWTGRSAQAVRIAKTLEHNDAGRLSRRSASCCIAPSSTRAMRAMA